ncbi:flippase-like domain-containing protein|uniref:lysylphosphatidylglycerol synthase transmembrane domain-containing protein n=1 Tax=Noviherbaspirillum sp. L7-7A TaxID=2850560 RepID=UPI001C2BF1CC|nr:lysylphosphatidylglycerol synthase transmembrane domain-containing protein [Noviherbaspirillum sp. L7-7A]MBV0879072.1 flippase-like domain-containing protein [Noviherbaspirillum sp. L7-7A]
MSSRARKWIKLGVQVLVSVGLVAFLVQKLDFGQIKTILNRPGGWPWLVGAFVLFNASKIVAALRLNIYQRHVGVVLSEGQNLRLYYAGMFLNLFLPGGIGGDGYKIFVLNRQQGVAVKKLVLVTLADRVSGLLCLLLLLCGLVPWVGLGWPTYWLQSVAGVGALFTVTIFIAGHRIVTQLKSQALARVFTYGIAVQVLQLCSTAALLAYLQLETNHYSPYLAVFLISSIAAVLPLSFGGIGVREMTFFYCLTLLKLDPSYGVAASSSFFIVTMASSLLGGAFIRNIKCELNKKNS